MIDFSKLRILIVDDETIVTSVLAEMLQELRVRHIKVAHSPDEAMELLESYKANVILSDIEMGKKSGFDLIQEAREKFLDAKYASVIFLTGHADPEIVKKAKELKVSGYLLKPVEKQKLKNNLVRVYNILLTSGRL